MCVLLIFVFQHSLILSLCIVYWCFKLKPETRYRLMNHVSESVQVDPPWKPVEFLFLFLCVKKRRWNGLTKHPFISSQMCVNTPVCLSLSIFFFLFHSSFFHFIFSLSSIFFILLSSLIFFPIPHLCTFFFSCCLSLFFF